MDAKRLKKCNEIYSEINRLVSLKQEIEFHLALSVNNRLLEDQEALDTAKRAIIEIYQKRIKQKEQEFAEA